MQLNFTDNNTNNQFERFIESIQTKLRLVSLRQLLGPYEKSDSVFHDYPIFCNSQWIASIKN